MVALDLHLEGHRTSRRGDSHRSGWYTTLESREQGRCSALSRELMGQCPTGSVLSSPGPSALIGCWRIWSLRVTLFPGSQRTGPQPLSRACCQARSEYLVLLGWTGCHTLFTSLPLDLEAEVDWTTPCAWSGKHTASQLISGSGHSHWRQPSEPPEKSANPSKNRWAEKDRLNDTRSSQAPRKQLYQFSFPLSQAGKGEEEVGRQDVVDGLCAAGGQRFRAKLFLTILLWLC